MNSIEASIRNTNTKGEINTLRSKGIVPAIVYGGENQNQKISVPKKVIKLLIDKENFSSNILTLNIEVLTVSNLMGEAIKRISNSTSVSDLFK